MVVSALFFLDVKGKVILYRNYRGDVPLVAAEQFVRLMERREEEEDDEPVGPFLTVDGLNYCHIRHANLYLLALTRKNSNGAAILLFLQRIVSVFTEYFGELEEESLRDNYVLVYELLDEMMDFGYAQVTETKVLKE